MIDKFMPVDKSTWVRHYRPLVYQALFGLTFDWCLRAASDTRATIAA